MGKRHPPSPDEIADFQAAVADAIPLKAPARAILERRKPPPRPLQRERDEAAAVFESLHGPLDLDDLIALGEIDSFLRTGLHRSVLRDLRRGRWTIQNHVDLHGMNRHEAHEAVSRFLADSLSSGKRCVRIVHGRGHGSPGREGILRQFVKGWLSRSKDVLAFCHPPASDGGEGALWVLLRSSHPRQAQ